MQLVSLQAETIEPVLQNRIVDIVLFERLALRMDERRTGRGPQVDEFGQVPEIELDKILHGRAAICSAVTTRSLSFVCSSFSQGSVFRMRRSNKTRSPAFVTSGTSICVSFCSVRRRCAVFAFTTNLRPTA